MVASNSPGMRQWPVEFCRSVPRVEPASVVPSGSGAPWMMTFPPTSEIDCPAETERAVPWTVIVAFGSGTVRKP